MKREEIEEMLEQVKDEYIQEAMPGAAADVREAGKAAEDIGETGRGELRRRKRKKPLLYLAGAAALGLLCLGVYQIGGHRISPEEVSSAEAQQIEETGQSGSRDSTKNPDKEEREEKIEPTREQKPGQAQAGTSPGMDYSIYFQEDFPSSMIAADYTLEAGGHRYEYQGALAAEPLGIDPESFTEIESTIYCDSDGKPMNMLFQSSNEIEGRYLTLTCSEKGNWFSCFPVEEANGVEYQGVPIYGYHYPYPERTSEPWNLEMYFRKDGVGYGLSSSGMTYDEAGAVMAAIFATGFRPSSYDLSKGEECYRTLETISFDQAKEAFEGNVPALEQVAGMTLEEGCRYFVDYRGGQVESRLLDLCYSSRKAYLMVFYRTAPYGVELENVIPASELSRESVARHGSENDEPGLTWYRFTIEYENYAIDITARCTEEMLWEYLGGLKK